MIPMLMMLLWYLDTFDTSAADPTYDIDDSIGTIDIYLLMILMKVMSIS